MSKMEITHSWDDAMLQKETAGLMLHRTIKMFNDIATKEKEAVIRLYLLRAVTENITVQEAVAKYKAEKAVTNEYADGVRSITNGEAGGNILSYECFIRLVPRCSMEAESVEWQDIEKEYVDFLEKGIGT